MATIRTFFKVILILSIFLGCKKDDSTNGNIHLLKKVITHDGDSISYTIFNYDVKNRLTGIIDSNNNGHSWSTVIEYNAQGNLIKYRMLYSNISNYYAENIDSFVYNSRNQVVKKLYKQDNNTYKLSHSYSYNALGRLITDTVYGIWNLNHTDFEYDNNGDIIQWQEYYPSPGGFRSYGINTVSYINTINPYTRIGPTVYFINGDKFLLSKNNRSRISRDDGSARSYAYEYNFNGLPKKSVVTDSWDNFYVILTIEYFYN